LGGMVVTELVSLGTPLSGLFGGCPRGSSASRKARQLT